MQEPLNKILYKVYQADIDCIKAPRLPAAFQSVIRKKREYGSLFLQAALVLVMLCVLTTAIVSAPHSNPGALAVLITDVSIKYEIAQLIPAGIQKLQLIFCITFNRCG